MATATITETLELPGGASAATCKKIKVRLRLVVDADTEGIGRAGDSPASVGGVRSTSPDGSGTYTFTGVRPNSGSSDDVITSPTGTVYELVIVYPDRPAVTRYISVPDSAGPHQVGDILTVAPDPLPTGQDLLDLIDAAGLDLTDLPNGVTADAVIGLDGGALVELTPAQVMATHTGDTVDAHDASAISYAGGTGMSATDVEAAIDELANEKANLAGAAFTGAVTVTGADLTVTGAGGGSLHLDTNPGDDAATLAIYGSGDTQPRIAVGFSVFDVPAINMGPGGSTAADVTLYRSAAGVVNANGGGLAGVGKGVVFTEQSAPSSPAANDITLYAADNGSGTTVLRTKDSAGTVTTLGSGGGTYTDEEAQDAVGTILVDGTTVDFTYSDATPSITAEVKATSITNSHISGSAAIALSKLATDPLARANHTGTQAGSTVDAATDAARGTVELATATEVLTGTDTGRAPTPSVLAPFAAHTRVSGALAETVPRHLPASAITLTSGRLHLVAISLPAGLTITSITFVSGAGLSGLSNQWFGLFDSSRVPLRLTGDDTSTAWALNTAKTLNLSSTYATTTAGLYYLGICVVASGIGTIAAQASTVIMTGFSPIISGSSSTGLTNPASCPNPAGALTATSTIPFAYVS